MILRHSGGLKDVDYPYVLTQVWLSLELLMFLVRVRGMLNCVDNPGTPEQSAVIDGPNSFAVGFSRELLCATMGLIGGRVSYCLCIFGMP